MYKLTGGNALLDVNLILTKASLEQNMKVADLGCGTTGYFIFPASKIVGRAGEVYAVDIMKTALEALKRRCRQESVNNVKIVWSNLEVFKATKIDSEKLDIALLINTLYQSKKRTEIIRESTRLLKKGGKLIIVEWKNVSLPFGPPLEERVNKKQLIIAAERMGLKLDEDFFCGQFHFGLVFKKI